MYLHGELVNKKGNIIKVEILTKGSRTPEYEITPDPDGLIHFPASEAVSIDSQINDTFDVLLPHSATIRLESAIELTELYCSSCMDAIVNIRRDGECIFAGFIEPQAYSQGFNDATDEVEINCIDVLSALQYSPYAGIGNSTDYQNLKKNAVSKSFLSLLIESIASVTSGLDISGKETPAIYYDKSRGLTIGINAPDIFSNISISELLFLGDDEDGTWSRQSVVEEILKYLNLHIEQEGFCFHIFCWDTAKRGETATWVSLNGEGGVSPWTTINEKTISGDLVADTGTTISVGETYNVISLTCEVEESEYLVESPLSDETIYSPYTKKWQKYIMSCATKDISTEAIKAFLEFIHSGLILSGELVTVTEWYIRLKNNSNWNFYGNWVRTNLYDTYCRDGVLTQETLPNFLGSRQVFAGLPGTCGMIGCGLISWGKVDRSRDFKDNSPVSSINMEDYLVISVGGNENDTNPYPEETYLQMCSPLAVYEGPSSGVVFSPSDETTTNYIVFTGSICLSPITKAGQTWANRSSGDEVVEGKDGQRYFLRQWWRTDYPGGPEIEDPERMYGLCPPDEDGPKLYEFKYSGIRNSNDTISKVSVIACMLIIGNKCLVETGTQGRVSDFRWQTYKTREQCASDDEYYQQSFTIGFDPKIGDMLIGTEFDMQNNVTYDLGIDIEGMAVPIKKSDNLHGKVIFQILGPINVYWDEVTKRHETFFRSEKWSVNSVPLMAHVENIYIKNFEVKIVSDNSMNDNSGDCDLIYMSDEDVKYVNKKDDLTFRITSALTSAERVELGVKDVLNLSTPVDTSGNGILSIYDLKKGEVGKPEQLFVDAAWREWHGAKVVMQQNMSDVGLNRFDRYVHPALPGKTFFIQGISRDLVEGEAMLNLKEIGND